MRYWEPAAEEDVDRIHDAACRMLGEMGMRIRNQAAVEVLADAGATRIDQETVRIPRWLTGRCIESAPSAFKVYDRRGGCLEIGTGEHHHLIGGTMTEVLEYPGWTRRTATLQDVRDLTRIVDALDCVDIAIPAVEGKDAPAGAGEILSCAEMLKNTTKFCMACPVEARANLAFVEMAKALAGTEDLSPRPTIGLLATIVPGYEIDEQAGQALLIAAREGLPIVLMGGGIQGAQGPATMAGTFMMKVAEQLAGLCIVQAARPGSPCLMDWGIMKLDMRTAEIEEAGPEYQIGIGVGAQLSRRYGIPSYACPSADAKIGDLQAGFEMAEGLHTALLSGIHVTVNAGTAARCSAVSYELLVLHNEMLRNMLRVRHGMIVNEDTLAVEVQREVGIRGDYLGHPHTLRHIRSRDEFLHKDLFDASGVRAPYQDALLRAQARWKQILAEHEVGVSQAEQKAIDEVVRRYGMRQSSR
jgi:trimethylamine--corrinoid protein Co-methyltransferase